MKEVGSHVLSELKRGTLYDVVLIAKTDTGAAETNPVNFTTSKSILYLKLCKGCKMGKICTR